VRLALGVLIWALRSREVEMLLQSHRSFGKMAKFDPATGAFETFSQSDYSNSLPTQRKHGIFDYLNSHRVILFRLGKELVVQVDDHAVNLTELSIELIPTAAVRCLRLRSSDGFAISIEYELPRDSTFEDDPTPFAEAEDFDFGELLVNVANDPKRQERLFDEP
jgi:hypothetical protein